MDSQSPQTRVPQINVDLGEYSFFVEPVTPTRLHSDSDEQRLPKFRRSLVEPPINRQKTSSRASKESRKLLAHILSQLERRQMPPPFLDLSTEVVNSDKGRGTIFNAMKESTNVKKLILESNKRFQASQEDDDDEEEEEGAFTTGAYSTDHVYELLIQLRDLLLLSASQGWHILDERMESKGVGSKSSSPFRLSRQSLQEPRQRSRSPSPSHEQLTVPLLLLTCIKILASVVLEECRFKIHSPRPSRPPNALQSVVLDLARILLHTNKHDPLIVAKVCSALVPAFSTFPPEMHPRLIAFFRDVVLRGALSDLQQLQGFYKCLPMTTVYEAPMYTEAPIVSIHVEAATEDAIGSALAEASQPNPLVTSTYAPSQLSEIYRISSIVAPLLGAILDSVGLDYGSLINHASTLEFQRLIRLLLKDKFDACVDLLYIISQHTKKARREAVSILLNNAPQIVGHRSVSLLEEPHYQDVATPWTSHRSHQFNPWYFDPPDRNSGVGSVLAKDCFQCTKPLRGFGLLCPFCLTAVHFYCFDDPEGNRIVQYASATGQHVQRVAMFRFSQTLITQAALARELHSFRTVNTFTLVLCFVCHLPLLGGTLQGLNCSSCMLFAHHDCLMKLPNDAYPPCDIHHFNSSRITIEWNKMHNYIVNHYDTILNIPEQQLSSMSMEEVSILHATLQMQMQIINNGIALGSVLVQKSGKSYTPGDFELHQTVRRLKNYLSFGNSACSTLLKNYLSENGHELSDHSILFSWHVLNYVSSQLKLPVSLLHRSPDLLNVGQTAAAEAVKASSLPFDVVSANHLHLQLGECFQIRLNVAADLFVSHLIQCGFLCPMDASADTLPSPYSAPLPLIFPLPSSLDMSPNIEVLVSAIEACLSDNDLCANELGFLLLVRRCWPDGLTPEYIISRLLLSITSWILAEDDNLAAVLSDRLAKQRLTAQNQVKQPKFQQASTGPTSEGVMIRSSDYLSIRQRLLLRYAAPWLLALHSYDMQNFSEMVFACCSAIMQNKNVVVRMSCDAKELFLAHSDAMARAITKLARTPVIKSISDDLVRRWLQTITAFHPYNEPIPSMPKLFIRGSDLGQLNQSRNPWNTLVRMAEESKEGFSTSVSWLHLIASCKAELPPSLLQVLADVASQNKDTLTDALTLIKSLLLAFWLSSTSKAVIQSIVVNLTAHLAPSIAKNIISCNQKEETLAFVRVSFSTFLSVAGCDRDQLFDMRLLEEGDVTFNHHVRKEPSRNIALEDPLLIPGNFLDAINEIMAPRDSSMMCLVTKFLAVFLVNIPQHEGDNFILRSAELMATCLWEAYDIQDQNLSSIRTQLLLRTLSIDSAPLERLLKASFHPSSSWEQRLLAIDRCFSIIVDVSNSAVIKQHRDGKWPKSMAVIMQIFFGIMWTDPNEEIRNCIETACETLLPAHFDAISFCLDTHLLSSSPEEITDFITFISQMQAFFNHKQLLSWKGLLEALSKTYAEETSNNSDPDVELARVSMLCMGLQMAANGVDFNVMDILHLKFYLLQVFGFRDVAIVPLHIKHGFRVQFGELAELATGVLSCIHPFVRLLDSFRTIEVSAAVIANINLQEEKHVTVLIGSVFVDSFLHLFSNLRDWTGLPFLFFKLMLEGLCITISKHDFEGKALRHLQPLLRKSIARAIELLSEEINEELRRIILSAIRTFIQRWSGFMGSMLYTSVEAIAQLLISQGNNETDVLVIQATSALLEILTMYAQNGIFSNLFKRQLDNDLFSVLGEVLNKKKGQIDLQETLLRDVLSRLPECDQTDAGTILSNVHTFIERVFDLDMSTNLATYVGSQLLQLTKRVIEWEVTPVDCDSILQIITTLLKRNRSLAQSFLPSSETILRILLHRTRIKKDTLLLLLNETVPIPSRTPNDPLSLQVGLHQVVTDILLDALRLKSRVTSPSVVAMVEALCDGEPSLIEKQRPSRYLELSEAGVYFLQASNWYSATTSDDFAASLAVARYICLSSLKAPREMISLLDRGTERLSHNRTTVRAWNIIALAAVSGSRPERMSSLLGQLSTFSAVHHRGMQAFLSGQTSVQESSLVDLNHGYIAIKLWVLMVLQSMAGHDDGDGEARVLAVWNELWAPFENLIRILESQSQMEQNMTFTTLLVSSIADLFIFLRGLNSPIGLNVSYQIAVLNRLQNLRIETTAPKLNRAFKFMSEAPPEVSMDVLMDQIAKDIIAAERLRLLETRGQVAERRVPDRQRRVISSS